MAKVLLAIPNVGDAAVELTTSVLNIIKESSASHDILWRPHKGKCNEHAYMCIANNLRESDCDYLLQIDADNPPLRNPLELIDLDKDIISCPTPTWKFVKDVETSPIQWNAYEWVPEKQEHISIAPGDGLQEVDAVGAGCVLIHRRVFMDPLMRREAWHRRWREDNGTCWMGLDLAFCQRARTLGFKVFAHWGYPCSHFNRVDLLQVQEGFKQWVAFMDENWKIKNGLLTRREEAEEEELVEKWTK